MVLDYRDAAGTGQKTWSPPLWSFHSQGTPPSSTKSSPTLYRVKSSSSPVWLARRHRRRGLASRSGCNVRGLQIHPGDSSCPKATSVESIQVLDSREPRPVDLRYSWSESAECPSKDLSLHLAVAQDGQPGANAALPDMGSSSPGKTEEKRRGGSGEGGGPFPAGPPRYRSIGLGRGSDTSCSEIREEPNTSGDKTPLTNAQRIEGLCFRRWAVFQRGRPMNRSFAHAEAVRTQAARPGGRQETPTFSLEPPLESRRGAGGGDRQAKKDPR